MKTLVVLAYLVIGILVTTKAEPDANENKVIEDQKVTDDQKIFRGKFSGKLIWIDTFCNFSFGFI